MKRQEQERTACQAKKEKTHWARKEKQREVITRDRQGGNKQTSAHARADPAKLPRRKDLREGKNTIRQVRVLQEEEFGKVGWLLAVGSQVEKNQLGKELRRGKE